MRNSPGSRANITRGTDATETRPTPTRRSSRRAWKICAVNTASARARTARLTERGVHRSCSFHSRMESNDASNEHWTFQRPRAQEDRFARCEVGATTPANEACARHEVEARFHAHHGSCHYMFAC